MGEFRHGLLTNPETLNIKNTRKVVTSYVEDPHVLKIDIGQCLQSLQSDGIAPKTQMTKYWKYRPFRLESGLTLNGGSEKSRAIAETFFRRPYG